jgi:mono/diheme cytochrome c family protein
MKNGVVLAVSWVLLGGFGSAVMAVAGESKVDEKKAIAALYLKNCSICHGDNGDGDTRARAGMSPQPRNFTTAQAAIELTRERMIKSVTEGRSGTAMVGHKGRLTPQQINDLVDFIRTNFMQIPTAEAGQQPAAVSLGEKIYTQNCAVCHGDNGNTAYWAKNGLNPPPRDFTSPEAQSVLTRSRMVHSVTHGRPGTGMMPFSKRLSADDIRAVVGYIRFKFMGVDPDKDSGAAPLALAAPAAEPAATAPPVGAIPGVDAPLSAARSPAINVDSPQPAPAGAPSEPAAGAATTPADSMPGMPTGQAVDMSLPVPNGLKGDLAWGRTFFMSNCFTCHGVTGQGDGPRAYFNIPRPRNFTSELARQELNRPRIYHSITNGRVGTVMPAWGKVLTAQQIAGLTEFVFQTFIQPSEAAAISSEADKKKAP